MKISVAVNGRTHEVDPDHAGTQIESVEPGVYSVLREGRCYEARVEAADDCVVVFIEGHRLAVEVRDPRRYSRQKGGKGVEGRLNVVAPMPGKVVRLLTEVGDTVVEGQGLLVVEAMKMQNELSAPKAGRVSAVTAREGATVSAGEVLAVIE